MSIYGSWTWEADQQEAWRPHLHLRLLGEQSLYQRRVKPILDVVLGVILMIVLSPLMIVSIAVVWLSMGSPVIYRQERVGLGGKPFQLYKLRTMRPDRRMGDSFEYTGPERRSTHKSPNDPRVVPVGAVMRSLRFDELPQLWNVVRGDMSLVGPRPELPDIVADYDDWQHHRHVVKPGLTGFWQVEAPKGKLMHECTEMDLKYVSDISLRNDLKILLRTPMTMFHRRGF